MNHLFHKHVADDYNQRRIQQTLDHSVPRRLLRIKELWIALNLTLPILFPVLVGTWFVFGVVLSVVANTYRLLGISSSFALLICLALTAIVVWGWTLRNLHSYDITYGGTKP